MNLKSLGSYLEYGREHQSWFPCFCLPTTCGAAYQRRIPDWENNDTVKSFSPRVGHFSFTELVWPTSTKKWNMGKQLPWQCTPSIQCLIRYVVFVVSRMKWTIQSRLFCQYNYDGCRKWQHVNRERSSDIIHDHSASAWNNESCHFRCPRCYENYAGYVRVYLYCYHRLSTTMTSPPMLPTANQDKHFWSQ